MPKASQKDKQQKTTIQGKSLKEIIPSNYQHIREPKDIQYPDQGENIYTPEYLPLNLFPEWDFSPETDIETFQSPLLQTEETEKFNDPDGEKVYLPLKLYKDYLNGYVKWISPEKYVLENNLDIYIKKTMPKKNSFRFREKVHKNYEEEKKRNSVIKNSQRNDEENNEEQQEDEQNSSSKSFEFQEDDEFLIYRDYFKIIDTPLNLYMVNEITREETDAEYNIRMKKREEELQMLSQQDKNKKKKANVTKPLPEETEGKIQITVPSANNICLKDNLPPFSIWLGSIFQIIKDRNLIDVKTGENIWQKIYPQKNGIPIYNSYGRYWVKLYHMGKYRKIEIDDKIPVSENYEYFLPKTEKLEELWPVILTKALLKLYSFKIISNSFYEIGDPHPFYALTGYVPSLLNLNEYKLLNINENNENNENSENINKIPNFLENYLSDENYENKNCVTSCYKSIYYNYFYKNKNTPNLSSKSSKKLSEFQIDENIDSEEEEEKIFTSMHKPKKIQKSLKSNKTLNDDFLAWQSKFSIATSAEKAKIRRNSTKSFSSKYILFNAKEPIFQNVGQKLNSELPIEEEKTDEKKEKYKKINDNLENYLFSNNIIKGSLYTIVDIFNNEMYNMDRLKPIDFSDIKAMMKNFNKNNVFKQLSRDEKKDYIHNLKEIKEKQREAKAQRIEKLKLNGDQYYSIKIENQGIDDPQITTKYNEEEIFMAKKCILNKWGFPPMDYLDSVYEKNMLQKQLENKVEENKKEKGTGKKISKLAEKMKQDEKLKEKSKEKSIEKNNEKNNENEKEKRTWSKKVYMQLIENNTEQYNNSIELLKRIDGNWIETNDFYNSFDKLLVLYNPMKYLTCFEWDNLWENTSDIFYPKEENIVLYLKSKTPEENSNDNNTNNANNTNTNINVNNNNSLILMYETITDNQNKLRNIPYKIRFLLIKKEGNTDEVTQIKIDDFYGCKVIENLENNKEYFLVYNGGILPEGFFVKLLSEFSLTPMTYQNFLTNHNGYNKQSFHIEHENLNKNQIYVLLRVSIINEVLTKFIIMTNNTKDKYSNKFIQINICEVENYGNKKLVDFNTYFELLPKEYILIITINPIYNVAANSYDIDILTLSDINNSMCLNQSQTNTAVPDDQSKIIGLKMEQKNNVAQYEITDKYFPNKHFVLFKEYLFAGEKVNALLNIQLIDENILNNIKNIQNTNPTAETENDVIEKSYFRLKLEIFNRENELIYKNDFYNSIILYNMTFDGNVVAESQGKNAKKLDKKNLEENTSQTNLPYLLKCTIDCSESENKCTDEEYMKKISWKILVNSTDTLGFCQDTSKEDKEKEVIASWEENESGRAELAKKSRQKFLIEQKLKSNEELTEEEKEILNQKRTRKTFNKSNEDENNENVAKGNKKNAGKGNDKNTKKKDEKTKNKNLNENNDESNKNNLNDIAKHLDLNINYNKNIDRNSKHSSIYIKNYLSYVYNNRLLTFNSNFVQEEKELNNEELQLEKEEKINNAFIECERQTTENLNKSKKSQEEFNKDNKLLVEKIINHRKKEQQTKDSFLQTRSGLATNIFQKIQFEKKISDIITKLNENPPTFEKVEKKKGGAKKEENTAYDEAIAIYKEAIKSKEENECIKKLFDVLSELKEKEYTSELSREGNEKSKKENKEANKELKANANKIKEELGKYKWKISEKLLEEINSILSSS